MVSLAFIILVVLAVALAVARKKVKKREKKGKKDSDASDLLLLYFLISCLVAVGFGVWIINLSCDLANGNTIDKKISMYEEENASIEKNIDVSVKGFMDFESRTYAELKDTDAINLVSLFPELKSDTLVKKQIKVYIDNNNKIKELKEEKINLAKTRWKLYFGK